MRISFFALFVILFDLKPHPYVHPSVRYSSMNERFCLLERSEIQSKVVIGKKESPSSISDARIIFCEKI